MEDQHSSHGEASDGGAHDEGPIPLGQRLFDSPFLLLIACIVVMLVFFTGWGLIEIYSLTEAPLP